jgi:uncharacterized protein (DUF885 family)
MGRVALFASLTLALAVSIAAVPPAHAARRPPASARSAATGSTARTPRARARDAALERLATEFANHWLATRPHEAARLGIRGHDGELVPVTQALLDSERTWHAEFARRLDALTAAVPSDALSVAARADREILKAGLDRQRLELESIRPFERDPNRTLALVDPPMRVLLNGRRGSLSARLRSMTRRLRQVPEVLRAAQVNLTHPSRPAVETSIPGFARARALYRHGIPDAASAGRDAPVIADLAVADTAAARALQRFIEWLRADLLPRSSDSLALGADTYARLIRYETLDDRPLDDLFERARRELQPAWARVPSGAWSPASLESLDAEIERRARAPRPEWPAGSQLRAVLVNPRILWGRLLEAQPDTARDAPEVATAWGALRDLATADVLGQTLAEIMLHARGVPFAGLADTLARETGAIPEVARRWASAAALNPGAAVTVVSAWQLRDLRDAARAIAGDGFDPRTFWQDVASQGDVTVPAIREAVLRRVPRPKTSSR